MRFLEGLPIPGNVVLEGLGQDMASMIEDWITRCEFSGRMANFVNYCLGGSGSEYVECEKGLNNEM